MRPRVWWTVGFQYPTFNVYQGRQFYDTNALLTFNIEYFEI